MNGDPGDYCPACGKPVYKAVYPPKDGPDRACSDPDCVNAHGIVNYGLPASKEEQS